MARSKALTKFHGHYTPHATIRTLLKQLGMPKPVWGPGPFWEHWQGQLDIILFDAKKLYRKHAARVHPRRDRDEEEESKQFNALWTEIERRFKQHMEPTLWITGKKPSTKDIPRKAPPGFYLRQCPFPKCGRVFLTKKKHKKYCHRLHLQNHCNMRRYYRVVRPKKKRKLLKCKEKTCGKLFWVFAESKRRFFCSLKCGRRHHRRLHYNRYPEKCRAIRARYYETHRAECLAQMKKYSETHREQINKRSAAWKKKQKRLAQRQTRLASQPLAKC